MFPLQPIPYFCTTGFASLRFHRTCPRLHSHPYLELNPWAFGSLPPDQALAVSPGTASNLQRGWNDSNQKTPNKTTTLINSLSFPHGNQSMLPEQLCPDTARVQLTPSMMFGCSRLCPRAKPSFRDQAETLSAAHPRTSPYGRFLCQVLLHPSFLSQGKVLHSPMALVPTWHLHTADVRAPALVTHYSNTW